MSDDNYARTTARRVLAALNERPLDDVALDDDVRTLAYEVLAPSSPAAAHPAEGEAEETAPDAGSEHITISLDVLWSSILVGIGGEHDAVPTTAQINRAVRLARRKSAAAAPGQGRERELPELWWCEEWGVIEPALGHQEWRSHGDGVFIGAKPHDAIRLRALAHGGDQEGQR